MILTPVGIVVLVLSVIAFIAGPKWIVLLACACAPFVQASAIIWGSNAFPPFYMVIVALAISLVLGRVRRRRRGVQSEKENRAQMHLVWWFWVYATLSAVVLPVLFAGIEVLVPRAGIDNQVADPGILEWSISNLAQVIYLSLACLFVYVSSIATVSGHAMITVTVSVGIMSNGLQFILNSVGASWNFDQFLWPNQIIYESSFGDSERFRGIYSEPSYLAVFAIIAFVYSMGEVITRFEGGSAISWTRMGLMVFNSAVSVILIFASFSGTAIVSILVIGALVILAALSRVVTRSIRINPYLVIAAVSVFIVVVVLGPRLLSLVYSLISDKTGSSSFENRISADVFSLGIMANSWFLGAGLGSSRPSSFLTFLLSNVGIVGTVLFGAVVVFAAKAALRDFSGRSLVWALIAVLVAKIVAEPNISNPLLWVAIASCVAVSSRAQVSEFDVSAKVGVTGRVRPGPDSITQRGSSHLSV